MVLIFVRIWVIIHPMPASDVIGAREAERLLGISQATLQRWVTNGRLPSARKLPGLRGPWLFDRSEVQELAAARKKVSA